MDYMDSRRWALPAMVASAALFYFGTGLAPIAALTWLAPLPVLFLAPRVSGRIAAGVAFGAYFLGTTNSWAFYARSFDLPLWPLAMLICFALALTFVLAVWIFRTLLLRGQALLAVTAAPAAWTSVLYLVSVFNPMGTQGTFATDQADIPVLLQTTSMVGQWGLEYLVLFVPAAIAALRLRTNILALVVVTLVLVGGTLRLTQDSGPTQRVAAVATNQHVWAPDLATPAGTDLVAAYVAEISALPAGVKTVVLPEQSFLSTSARPAALVEPMSRVAQSRGVDIIVGFAHRDATARYNYALAFLARGGDPVSYLKHHDTVSPPGHDLVFLDRTGIEICMDVNLANPSRDYGKAGARLLAIPASDEMDNGWQHSRTALLRGAEHGQAVVWSGRTGTVMISDGLGRVLADASTGGSGPFTTIVADVPTGPGATLYTRLGDWFAWLCLALTLVGLISTRRRVATEG